MQRDRAPARSPKGDQVRVHGNGRTLQDPSTSTPAAGDDGAIGGTTPFGPLTSALAVRTAGTTSSDVLFPPDLPGIAFLVAREALFALATPLEWVQKGVRPWLSAIPRRSRNRLGWTRVELAVAALRG